MKTDIIIPHKHTGLNDQCLKLCIEMLRENSSRGTITNIIVDDSDRDPYEIWNQQSIISDADIVVFTNTDVLMGPMWDTIIKFVKPNSIVTGYLIECGAIPVHHLNIERHFGKTPASFMRTEFENFCIEHGKTVPEIKEERAWYMPCAMDRKWFVSTGGFDMKLGSFREHKPLDIYFWETCIKQHGFILLRAKSYAYHFQNLSNEKRVKRE